MKIKKISHFEHAKTLTRPAQIDHILYLQKKIKGLKDFLLNEGLSIKYAARLKWSIIELRQYKRAANIKGNLIGKY